MPRKIALGRIPQMHEVCREGECPIGRRGKRHKIGVAVALSYSPRDGAELGSHTNSQLASFRDRIFFENFARSFRRYLSLLNNCATKMMRGLEPEHPFSARAQPRSLRDDAMEPGPFLRGCGRRRAKEAQSARRALQNLLAAGFRFHLQAGPFRPRGPGSDAGFFCYGA